MYLYRQDLLDHECMTLSLEEMRNIEWYFAAPALVACTLTIEGQYHFRNQLYGNVDRIDKRLLDDIKQYWKLKKEEQEKHYYQYCFQGIPAYFRINQDIIDQMRFMFYIKHKNYFSFTSSSIRNQTHRQHGYILKGTGSTMKYGLQINIHELRNEFEHAFMPTFEVIDQTNLKHKVIFYTVEQLDSYLKTHSFSKVKQKIIRTWIKQWKQCNQRFQIWSNQHNYQFVPTMRNAPSFFRNYQGIHIRVVDPYLGSVFHAGEMVKLRNIDCSGEIWVQKENGEYFKLIPGQDLFEIIYFDFNYILEN